VKNTGRMFAENAPRKRSARQKKGERK